jgi:hypothetical protein
LDDALGSTIFATRLPVGAFSGGTEPTPISISASPRSTYLGHAKVSDTYWYLTGVPELMALAGARFERFGREGDDHASRA